MKIEIDSLRNVIVVMMIAIVGLSLSSCRDDDNQSGGNQSAIIQDLMSHKWYGKYEDFDEYSYGVSLWTESLILYFTSEDEGVLHIVTYDRDSSLGTSRYEDHIDFTYYISGNKVYISTGLVFDYYGSYMMEGDDIFEPSALTSSDYTYLQEHQAGYHGKEGEINADMFFETSLYNTQDTWFGDEILQGWNAFYIDYRVGTSYDGYRKGISQMRVTVWASNATYASYKTSDYGKKHTQTFYLSASDLTFIDRLWIMSKDRTISLNYEVEYYNTKDSRWYTFKTGSESFSM